VVDDRKALVAEGRLDPPRLPAPPVNNGRALTHGAHSEQRRSPLREGFAKDVRRRWPELNDLRVAMAADLMARIELARRWADRYGIVKGGRKGDVPDAVVKLDMWTARLHQLEAQVEAERRGRTNGPSALAAHLEAKYGDGKAA
jgi:hypothetical protein